MTTNQSKTYLTVKELAAQMRVTPQTVYAWVRSDRVPYVRRIGKILFDSQKIAEWLEGNSDERGDDGPAA